MKRWRMLDSVGLTEYRERKTSNMARGSVQVCLIAKCLQRRRNVRDFLRLEKFFCSLGWRTRPLDEVADKESDE